MQARLLKIYLLLLVIVLSLEGTLVFAAPESANTLQDIQVTSATQYERIELFFEKNLTTAPLIDFEQGLIFLRLSAVSMETPIRQFDFPQSKLIRTIRTRKNTHSTSLEIVFHSPNLSLRRSLEVKTEGQRLLIDLNRQLITILPEESVAENDITREVEQRLRESDSFSSPIPQGSQTALELADKEPTLATLPEEDWLMTLLTFILSLFLIFAVLILLLYLYKKLLSGRFPTIQGKFKIQTVSTFHISPRQKILVLEVNGQYFACGVTTNNITFLAEVRDKQDQSFLGNITLNDDEIELKADHSRAEFLKTLENARQKAQKIEKAREQSKMAPPPESPNPADPLRQAFVAEETQTANFEKTLRQETSKGSKPQESAPSIAEVQKPNTKKFNTPVLPETEMSVLETDFKNDDSLQHFAKKFSQKLKALKPIE